MNFKIPERFNLHGFEISVKLVNNFDDENDTNGKAVFRKDEILIQAQNDSSIITKARQGQVFCHELVHWILNQMGEDKLCNNEKFVDLFGSLLFQAFDSAEYGGKK